MRLFKNANTTFKILSLVAVLLVFLSAISLAGYFSYNKTTKRLANLHSNFVTPAMSALDAKVIATENRHLLSVLPLNSYDESPEIIKRIRNNRKKIEMLSTVYMSGNFSNAEKQCAVELSKLREDVFRKQEEVFTAIGEGGSRRDIARRLAEGGDISRLEDAYLATADRFTNFLVRMADYHINHTARIANAGAMHIAIISFAAVVFGISLAVLIARSITTPMKRMGEAVSAFSRGAFDCEVELDGPDEIAQMGQNLREMAGNLQRVVASARQASREMSGMAREFTVLVKESSVSAGELQVNADDMKVHLSQVVSLGVEIHNMLGESDERAKEVAAAVRKMLQKANEVARSGERMRHNILETAAVTEYLSKGSGDLFRFSCDLERTLAFFETADQGPRFAKEWQADGLIAAKGSGKIFSAAQ